MRVSRSLGNPECQNNYVEEWLRRSLPGLLEIVTHVEFQPVTPRSHGTSFEKGTRRSTVGIGLTGSKNSSIAPLTEKAKVKAGCRNPTRCVEHMGC